jgi:hypothetical protein
MKIQIERKEVKLEFVDVNFPIYSYIEESDCTIYTKLTRAEFQQIKVSHFEVNITRFKSNNKSIAEIWFNNQCDSISNDSGIAIDNRETTGTN